MASETTHQAEAGGDDHGHHGVGHVVPIKILVLTGLGLLVLTWLTVEAASVDFESGGWGDLDIFLAMGIALIKATLVVLFFMHLWWDRPFNSFVLVGSIACVALFIALSAGDVLTYAPNLLPGDSDKVLERLGE